MLMHVKVAVKQFAYVSNQSSGRATYNNDNNRVLDNQCPIFYSCG